MATAQRLVGDRVLIGDELVADAAIDIDRDGRIVAVGPVAGLPTTTDPVRPVGGLLMPGLVNAHAHTPMTLVRSGGDGAPLQEWLTEHMWPREGRMTGDDARTGMTLGWAEMLQAGVTTTCEMYLHEEAVVAATEEAGGRLVMTPAVVSALAPDGRLDDRLGEMTDFHRDHHRPEHGISVGFAPHSIYDLSPAQVREISDEARARDALLHIHLEETTAEREGIRAAHGASATELLAEIGALDGRFLGAHGVWLSDTDQALLGAAGAAIAHCPISNLKLGSGIAPVTDMLAAGITVGLGTDGVASNDNLDLWEELKLAPLLARGTRHDAGAMDAATALRLATADAAAAVGLDDVGQFEAGYWADVIRIDLDHPAYAPGIEGDLLTMVVFAGSSTAVRDVWVAGRQVVDDGVCTTIDVAATVTEARRRGRRLLG